MLSALARLAGAGEIEVDAAQLDRAFALRERIRVLEGLYVALAKSAGAHW